MSHCYEGEAWLSAQILAISNLLFLSQVLGPVQFQEMYIDFNVFISWFWNARSIAMSDQTNRSHLRAEQATWPTGSESRRRRTVTLISASLAGR